jgi:class 3 adenylate cyclase
MHALMQETLLGELSTTRRVRLHGQVGEALERRWGARAQERASRLAPHFVEAAMVTPRHAEKAVRYSKLAAQQAEALFAWAEAAKHYEDCLTLVSEAEGVLGEDEAALLTSLGACARNAGDYRDAWRSLMRAITVYRMRGDAPGMARATLDALQIDTPPGRQVQLVREVLEALGDSDPHLEARLLAVMAEPRFALQKEEAEHLTKRATDLARTHGLPDVEALVAFANGLWANVGGDFARAATLFADAHTRLAAAGELRTSAVALQNRTFNLLLLGDLDKTRAAAEESLAYARGHHIRFAEMVTSDFLAAVLLARCEYDAFDALSEERGANAGYLLGLMRAGRAEAAGHLDEAVALLPDPRIAGGYPLYLVQIHAGRARVMLNAGHEGRAREEFARMRDAMNSSPTSREVHGVTLHGAAFGSLDEARILGDDDFARAMADFREAPAGFDPTGRSSQRVASATYLYVGRLQEAETGFRDALAWCERERCPIEAGRCEQGLAEVADRRGNTAEAMRLLDQAGERFRQHGATFYLDQVIKRKLELQGADLSSVQTSIEAVTLAVERERPDISVHAALDGKVTLMFSDIEDSTPLTERLGDERWVEVLREHNAIFREHIAAHAGHEVKTIGDAFMVAFPSAEQALACAVSVQRAFARYNSDHADQPLGVRIGLHTGQAVHDEGDFYGTNVVLASRLVNQAGGGEIVVSTVFRQLVESLPKAAFGPVREVSLKGLSGKHHVHTVEWAAGRARR